MKADWDGSKLPIEELDSEIAPYFEHLRSEVKHTLGMIFLAL